MVSQPSPRPWGRAGSNYLCNFITQIKNKLNNLIVSTFLLLFVNKIMFTKCFFSASKVVFFCEMGAFFAKNVLFFLGRVLLFKCFCLHKSTMIPVRPQGSLVACRHWVPPSEYHQRHPYETWKTSNFGVLVRGHCSLCPPLIPIQGEVHEKKLIFFKTSAPLWFV